MNNFNSKYNEYLNFVNDKLDVLFSSLTEIPDNLLEAMRYSVFNGGKRIRPVLMLATADFLGVDNSKIIYFAMALELIHSYSLVHDDLPAMDNDDYRRGKLSTHKKYGEDMGILVGDALLNLSIETAIDSYEFTNKDKLATQLLFKYSGANGMIKGQYLDLREGDNQSKEILNCIHDNKTAKLIKVSLLIPSIFADNKYYNELLELGDNLGLMFQIKDDILDVEGDIQTLGKTPNKDENSGKLTFVSLYGLDCAKTKLQEVYNDCIKILDNINGSEFLYNLTQLFYERNK